jgi:hypothetical protein
MSREKAPTTGKRSYKRRAIDPQWFNDELRRELVRQVATNCGRLAHNWDVLKARDVNLDAVAAILSKVEIEQLPDESLEYAFSRLLLKLVDKLQQIVVDTSRAN